MEKAQCVCKEMDQSETVGVGCHPCEWITPSFSLTFSVSMSAGVKSSSGDLWIFTQDS